MRLHKPCCSCSTKLMKHTTSCLAVAVLQTAKLLLYTHPAAASQTSWHTNARVVTHPHSLTHPALPTASCKTNTQTLKEQRGDRSCRDACRSCHHTHRSCRHAHRNCTVLHNSTLNSCRLHCADLTPHCRGNSNGLRTRCGCPAQCAPHHSGGQGFCSTAGCCGRGLPAPAGWAAAARCSRPALPA